MRLRGREERGKRGRKGGAKKRIPVRNKKGEIVTRIEEIENYY